MNPLLIILAQDDGETVDAFADWFNMTDDTRHQLLLILALFIVAVVVLSQVLTGGSSVKFCMFRAPIWRMSAYFSTRSIWLLSITSVTTFNLYWSAAARRRRRASSPNP